MRSKWRSTFLTVMCGVSLLGGAALAEPSVAPGTESPREAPAEGAQSWVEALASGEGTSELVRTRDGGLLYEPTAVMRRPEAQRRLMGLYTFPARTLAQPVDTVQPHIQAKVFLGMAVEVDVRVRTAHGTWSEWSTSSEGEAVRLPRAGTEVQVRLALLADEQGRGPLVREVRLEGRLEGGTQQELQSLTPLTYRIFATREGLVGGTTANGHVIRTNDRFVALPSRRGLSSKGGSEYQVRVCYSKTSKCATTSVWDVGPWNIKDDYWNPSTIREMWKDLPQGKPQAQAAYLEGYNGGLDGSGRRPSNPAGIDIADGTFWTDLGMSNNDWVNVTYLWTTGGSPGTTGLVVDNNNANNNAANARFSVVGTWTAGANTGFYGNGYVYAATEAISAPAVFEFYLAAAATKTIDAWWVAGTNRSTTAPFVVTTSTGNVTVNVNQQVNGGQWNTLGTWSFPAGWNKVQLSRWTGTGFLVVADAIQVR